MRPSLTSFFNRVEPVNLNACDIEKIHLTGAIQALGALVVIDTATERVIGASENAEAVLSLPPGGLREADLGVLGRDLSDAVRKARGNGSGNWHRVIGRGPELDGVAHDAVLHWQWPWAILEFVPNAGATTDALRRALCLAGEASTGALAAPDFDAAAEIAVDAVQRVTGFGRVKIYRFLQDGSGEVVAECRDPRMPSFLGLRFPPGDIPRQVRALYSLAPIRAIGSVRTGEIPIRFHDGAGGNLDLTQSVLRAVSPMHVAYLRNMGVDAALSCALFDGDALWGLIVAHDDRPGLVPVDLWFAIRQIATTLMQRYRRLRCDGIAAELRRLREVERRFALELRGTGDAETAIRSVAPVLQGLLNADGMAFQLGEQIVLAGRTPPESFVRRLLRWSKLGATTGDQLHTNALHGLWSPALQHSDTACGVLLQPLAVHRVCKLVWFRGARIRTVRWAGEPDAKDARNRPQRALRRGPRNSFAPWEVEETGECAPWTPIETAMAPKIVEGCLDVLAAHLLQAEDCAASRGAPAGAVPGHADADAAGDRAVTDHRARMLEYTLLRSQHHRFAEVDPTEVACFARDLLSDAVAEAGAQIRIGEMPSVVAHEGLMLRMFMLLFDNALRRRAPERPVKVQVDARIIRKGGIELAIQDNGTELPADLRRRLYEPLPRPGRAGSVLDLAICRRIADVHGGTFSLGSAPGIATGFTVRLPLDPTGGKRAARHGAAGDQR